MQRVPADNAIEIVRLCPASCALVYEVVAVEREPAPGVDGHEHAARPGVDLVRLEARRDEVQHLARVLYSLVLARH